MSVEAGGAPSPADVHSHIVGSYPYLRIWPDLSSTQASFLKGLTRRNTPLFRPKHWKLSTYPLHPIKTNNARALRLAAAAGTELAGASSRFSQFLQSANSTLQKTMRIRHACVLTGSDLRPLPKILHCCPP